MPPELLHETDTARARTYPCSEFLTATDIKDEFHNLCTAAELCDVVGVRNVGKTTRMKVQPYELKSLFASLCSKDPQDIHRGKISSILFPPHQRHEFVTRTSEFGNLVYIMRYGEFTTRENHLPAPLLFDYTSRNGWAFTAIELDEFVIQQQFHNPMEEVVPEEGEPEEGFGEVIGLCTNFRKSSVVPIWCNHLELGNLTQSLPSCTSLFPIAIFGPAPLLWKLKLVDFQFLVYKVACKLSTYDDQNITSIGRTTLVKSVIASQLVYTATPPVIPPNILHNINKLERAFLWSGADKTMGARCKVDWEWPWYEWKEPTKMWAGMGNPCDQDDLHFFYASTTITLGNGAQTPFWDSPWFLGRRSMDISPLNYGASMRKNWKVREALKQNTWVLKINTPINISAEHISQFLTLWMLLNEVHLDVLTEDDIVWKHTASGHYSATSVYKAQFLGLLPSPMGKMVWKVWVPRKIKFFSCLALQDRIWTADRLARRGWPKCDLCPLSNRMQECGPHIFYECRFTRRLWSLVIQKFHWPRINTSAWSLFDSVKVWWESTCAQDMPNRQARPP
ncbi:Serine carboxypeptidase-like 18 [Hordeum vulgare]|nr:Serine carboxypeptidase-like 18 [Hordeum vulgare]